MLGGNFVHEHKSIKFEVEENDSLQSISKSAEQTKKSGKIASPQNTAHIF